MLLILKSFFTSTERKGEVAIFLFPKYYTETNNTPAERKHYYIKKINTSNKYFRKEYWYVCHHHPFNVFTAEASAFLMDSNLQGERDATLAKMQLAPTV
jgi:hypothetical protein